MSRGLSPITCRRCGQRARVGGRRHHPSHRLYRVCYGCEPRSGYATKGGRALTPDEARREDDYAVIERFQQHCEARGRRLWDEKIRLMREAMGET